MATDLAAPERNLLALARHPGGFEAATFALVEAVDVGLHFTPHGQRFLQQSVGGGISQQQDLRVIAQALLNVAIVS